MGSLECESKSIEKREEQEILEDEEESFSYAMQLAVSVALPMALQAAIELGVFEVLQNAGKGARLSADDIVSCLSKINNPEASKMLDRILAFLSSHSVLKCFIAPNSSQRYYCLTRVAEFFAPNFDGFSLGPLTALSTDKIILASWSHLKDAIQDGDTPFNRAHGSHFFDLPNLDSRFNQVFNKAMSNHTTIVMKKVLECYKGFRDIKRLVDVGGGLGININMITSKYTHIQGINYDLPHVIQHAPSYPGVEHIGGDMFESVPNGDAIFMKWILHDWNDERCLKLLKNCYDAIPDDGKVIVLDALLPIMPKNEVAWKSISQMDIAMMNLFPEGKERTKQEFMDLATKAGFRCIKYECCTYNLWVMEFFK
ncbi:anthranilate N-methyltransferase-like isoform X1 [Trifolium pratense]|uniref:anthranilate N-methyltransferase-like isoform X1 n=1 Tax=Trifolium pratense TaxID=57577 RepID=UPI001E692970|nr:anthranilate N-methyltransferase-like isoform X1 [Trifolium pratense]